MPVVHCVHSTVMKKEIAKISVKKWRAANNRISITISWLQTTCETAANMFHECLVRKNYAAQELPARVSQFVLFSY